MPRNRDLELDVFYVATREFTFSRALHARVLHLFFFFRPHNKAKNKSNTANMSREGFVPPMQINPPTIGYVGGTGGQSAATTSSANLNDTSKPVRYKCGECSSAVHLRRHDPVRCHECGHRVLYKERTNKYAPIYETEAE